MDALGHVNNTVYFRFCESARIAYFEAIGLDDFIEDQHPPAVPEVTPTPPQIVQVEPPDPCQPLLEKLLPLLISGVKNLSFQHLDKIFWHVECLIEFRELIKCLQLSCVCLEDGL